MCTHCHFRLNILYTNINTTSEGASSEMMIQMVSVGEKWTDGQSKINSSSSSEDYFTDDPGTVSDYMCTLCSLSHKETRQFSTFVFYPEAQ